MIYYLKDFLYAAMCTVGFAIIFNAPKSSFIKSGFAGGIGWLIYIITKNLSSSLVLSSFVAALAIALIGEYFAFIDKNPLTIYIIPGIIPLVPGFGLYYTMLSIAQKEFNKAAIHGSETLLISVAIASALVIVLSIVSYRRQKHAND